MAAPLKEVKTLISAIEEGDYDEYLGPIMKALFNRRKAKTPSPRGVNPNVAAEPQSKRLGQAAFEEAMQDPSIARRGLPKKKHRRIDDEPDGPDVVPSNTRKLLGNKGGPATALDMSNKIYPRTVQNFGASASDKKVYFEYGNKYYLRSDVMGKAFALPSTFKPSNLVGYRVRITGIGPARLKVEFVDKPSPGMSYYDHAQSGQPIWLPKGLLAPYLH